MFYGDFVPPAWKFRATIDQPDVKPTVTILITRGLVRSTQVQKFDGSFSKQAEPRDFQGYIGIIRALWEVPFGPF